MVKLQYYFTTILKVPRPSISENPRTGSKGDLVRVEDGNGRRGITKYYDNGISQNLLIPVENSVFSPKRCAFLRLETRKTL